MARYKLKETSFIGVSHKFEDREQNNALLKEGAEFEIANDVIPGTHWEPLDKAAETAHKAMLAEAEKSAAKAAEQTAAAQRLASALQAA